jgi:hypothetical protein
MQWRSALTAILYFWANSAAAQPQPDATYICSPRLTQEIKRPLLGQSFERDTRVEWGQIEVSLKFVEPFRADDSMYLYSVTIHDIKNDTSYYCEGGYSPRQLTMIMNHYFHCRTRLTNFNFDLSTMSYTASQQNMKPPSETYIEIQTSGRCDRK